MKKEFFIKFAICYFLVFNFSFARVCYTNGVYDMFHIGHVNALRNAKKMCDTLIVGVHTDEVVQQYKNKTPIIPFEERIEVIKAVKYPDIVIPDVDHYVFDTSIATDKNLKKYKIDTLIAGDDHINDYKEFEAPLKKAGIEIVFLPYTKSQSSTKIRNKLQTIKK